MTELVYMSSPVSTEIDAILSSIDSDNGTVTLILDRTPFYPQGGGQPSDTGTIEGDGFTFAVQKAVLIDGVVHHQGIPADGEPATGAVRARIDTDRRALNARLHSGGHLIMTAVFELTGLRAVKGYHFPEGPYVEFDGTLDEDAKAALVDTLQQRLDDMINADEAVQVESTTAGELVAEGVFMPTEIPADKPTRVVTTFGYRSPCGGTHIMRTGELAGLRVRRIKSKSGRTRVAYEFSDS